VTGEESIFRNMGGACFVTGRILFFVTGVEPVFRDGLSLFFVTGEEPVL